MPEKKVFVGVKFPPDAARELRLLARLEGVTASEAVRRAVRQRAEKVATGSRGS
jgi:hypothetical protein